MIKNLKIGPIVYGVSLEKDLHDFTDDWRKRVLNGVIKYDPCLIRVSDDLSPQRQNIVVMHEALHGILEQSGIEHDEQIVMALGFGLVAFIQDNPEFVRQIWEIARQAEKPKGVSEAEQLKRNLTGSFDGAPSIAFEHSNGNGS